MVEPGIRGVQHYPILHELEADKGYVVTYIPQHQGPPVQSVASRAFHYRSGSNFLPMPQWMVADRFRQRPQPILEVFLLFGKIEGMTTAMANCQIDICVRNVGAGIANHVAVSLYSISSLSGHSNMQRKQNLFPTSGNSMWKTFALAADEPLFPGSYTKLAYFSWSFPTDPDSNLKFADQSIQFKAFCDGAFAEGALDPQTELARLGNE